MKLYDCRSYSLLPRFARNEFMESLCGAVDALVRVLSVRCDALPCENSASSLATCRDDELAQIADDLGVVPYYPDLPRTTRENQILQAKTWTRYAGTSGAVIAMVNALFDTDSTVIDDERPDDFHYLIDISDNFVESTEINFKRFNECLEKIGHTTTTPDGFIFRYDGTFETNVTALSGDVLELYDTDSLCEYPEIVAVGGVMGMREMRLYAVGSMERGGIEYPERTLTENNEVYGNKLEIWHSSYMPHPVVFPDAAGETSDQMASGTIRKWGTKANRNIDTSVEGMWMSAGAVTYPTRQFKENHEVYGDRLEIWPSSYTPHAVVFPEKSGAESSVQMMSGTLRKWGTKANRGVEIDVIDGSPMTPGAIKYSVRTFSENNEVYGNDLKVYTKPPYVPIVIVFPEKPQDEPTTQMAGGTIRITGTKANRGILLNNTYGSMPN